MGVEGQAADLLDLIDADGLRLLWHPSLACLPGIEYRGCGTPRRIGLRCTGCTGPKFPGFTDRPLVRWAP